MHACMCSRTGNARMHACMTLHAWMCSEAGMRAYMALCMHAIAMQMRQQALTLAASDGLAGNNGTGNPA